MAYNAVNEKQEVVALINKNSKGEYIQISRIIPESGNRLQSVDVRNMYTTKDDEIKPTSKGVRVNSELLPEVVSNILKAMTEEELEETMELFEASKTEEEDEEGEDEEGEDEEGEDSER